MGHQTDCGGAASAGWQETLPLEQKTLIRRKYSTLVLVVLPAGHSKPAECLDAREGLPPYPNDALLHTPIIHMPYL